MVIGEQRDSYPVKNSLYRTDKVKIFIWGLLGPPKYLA